MKFCRMPPRRSRATAAQHVEDEEPDYDRLRHAQGDELNSLMREILVRQSHQMDKLLARELAQKSAPPSVPVSPPVQRQMDLSSERFRMNNPPFFSGARDPAKVEEWVRTIEGIFEYVDIPPRDQMKCATHLLRESARHWWDAKRRVTNVSGLGWKDFKQM